MKLQEAMLHCGKAWSQYAEKNNIRRDDEFYFFKIQEELGEFTRTFMELHGRASVSNLTQAELQKKFAGDVASLVGNALILAHHFDINLEAALKTKFTVS